MNQKHLIKIMLVLLVVGTVFSFVLPPLMSAKSDASVIAGLVIIMGLIIAAVLYINKLLQKPVESSNGTETQKKS